MFRKSLLLPLRTARHWFFVFVLLTASLISAIAGAVETRSLCNQTASSNAYTGTFPNWLDGTATLHGVDSFGSYSVFLGRIAMDDFFLSDSILNSLGLYGSAFQTNSIFNGLGSYGSSFTAAGACNSLASSAPKIVWNNSVVGILTANSFTSGAVNPVTMVSALLAKRNLPTNLFMTGWNLVGNGNNAAFDVGTTFGSATNVITVWKWIPTTNRWAFFAPTLIGQALIDYAGSKGYDVLTTINGGEGYWVNAKQVFSIQMSTGSTVLASDFKTSGSKAMNQGWNLISVGETQTLSAFNMAMGVNLTTLWAWNSSSSNWYFYAPSLDGSGTLASYITSKGYLDGRTHTPKEGDGFWVNKSTCTATNAAVATPGIYRGTLASSYSGQTTIDSVLGYISADGKLILGLSGVGMRKRVLGTNKLKIDSCGGIASDQTVIQGSYNTGSALHMTPVSFGTFGAIVPNDSMYLNLNDGNFLIKNYGAPLTIRAKYDAASDATPLPLTAFAGDYSDYSETGIFYYWSTSMRVDQNGAITGKRRTIFTGGEACSFTGSIDPTVPAKNGAYLATLDLSKCDEKAVIRAAVIPSTSAEGIVIFVGELLDATGPNTITAFELPNPLPKHKCPSVFLYYCL